MKKLFKIHKFAGITAGLVLIILGLTGFFLDHKNWSWLYEVRVNNSFLPQSTIDKEAKLYQTHLNCFGKTFIATNRGVYVKDSSTTKISLDVPSSTILFDPLAQVLFAATHDGVYSKTKTGEWKSIALKDSYINAMSLAEGQLFASVDKKFLYLINLSTNSVEPLSQPQLMIQERDISLGRFVRDLHYGRGLFDDGWSLLLNDIAALYLVLLGVSGYWMFIIIRRQRRGIKSPKHYLKKLTKIHASWIAIVLIIPFFILLVTGVFLDHSRFFQGFLKSTKVPSYLQPSVYSSLNEDVWSVDHDAKTLRIGNRFGIYESTDKKTWTEVSRGFAYKMMRLDSELYVSGMGAANRKQKVDGSFAILPKTPHMFKSVSREDGLKYSRDFAMSYADTSLYSIILTLHDGTFFASWWIWVNDYASLMLFILFITGGIRFFKKKRIFKRS